MQFQGIHKPSGTHPWPSHVKDNWCKKTIMGSKWDHKIEVGHYAVCLKRGRKPYLFLAFCVSQKATMLLYEDRFFGQMSLGTTEPVTFSSLPLWKLMIQSNILHAFKTFRRNSKLIWPDNLIFVQHLKQSAEYALGNIKSGPYRSLHVLISPIKTTGFYFSLHCKL